MDGGGLDDREAIFFIGQHDSERTAPVTSDALSQSQELGYDFVISPITTPAFHSRIWTQLEDYLTAETSPGFLPMPNITSLQPRDSTLQPQDSNGAIVGLVSPWIHLGSRDPVVASVSRQVLNLEAAYAAFCGISNLVIHGPLSDADPVQFARDVREALALGPYLQLHLFFPMTGDLESGHGELTHLSELTRNIESEEDDDESRESTSFAQWDTWNTIRTVCSYSQKLFVALELPRSLPTYTLQSRWYSEPVRVLAFPRTSFLRNAKSYPVLSKQHQQFVYRFSRLRFPPWLLLSDVGSPEKSTAGERSRQTQEPTPAEASSKAKAKASDPTLHLQYLRHLQHNQPSRPPIEVFGRGYEDYLQSPLQPLTDNLESMTYEGFEKDPIKYEWYERAIAAALHHLINSLGPFKSINVAVAGAGRGPLVTRALKAGRTTGIPIRCWAVEKNPNALVLLRHRNATDALWNNQVQVIKSDMRHWAGPTDSTGELEKVDILVSELLGSFGDNELSPECLDGVQHVLHPEHGISIPQSYSAHLTPISTPRLHGDLLGRTGSDRWELPYVVMLHQYDYLCTRLKKDSPPVPEIRAAWAFSHPVPPQVSEHSKNRAGGNMDGGGCTGGDGQNEHNARACRATFSAGEAGVCHGLAGYFESVLYASQTDKIEISINPNTIDVLSKDMISWFPIFFPLKTPIYIPRGSEIEVSMWRQTDDRTVWYEWIVEVFEAKKRPRRRVAISELHSSRKNACLT